MLKDYDMSVLYHPGKTNVVANPLSRMTINSVSYVEEVNKDLLKYVHRLARLGVILEDFPNCGFMIHHNFKSSFVVEVKSNQHIDPSLMELKEYVL